jgi:hypothetical protein
MGNIQKILEESQQTLEELQTRVAKESEKLKESIKEQLTVKLEADKLYETRWIYYHTILGLELFVIIGILLGIWWKI